MINKASIYKSIGVLLILLSISSSVLAQRMPMNLPNYDKKSWHFGFTLGMNVMNFRATPIVNQNLTQDFLVIEPVSSNGFNIGIVANKRLMEYLDLRFVPTLSFGQRNLRYIFNQGDTIHKTYIKTVESTYLDFPFEIKYKGMRLPDQFTNIRPYVVAGARYSLDLSSQKDKKINNDEIVIKLLPHDFMYQLGVGFDFYLKYFKFGVELKTAFGLLNNLHKETNQFTYNIDKLTSQITWITFTFE